MASATIVERRTSSRVLGRYSPVSKSSVTVGEPEGTKWMAPSSRQSSAGVAPARRTRRGSRATVFSTRSRGRRATPVCRSTCAPVASSSSSAWQAPSRMPVCSRTSSASSMMPLRSAVLSHSTCARIGQPPWIDLTQDRILIAPVQCHDIARTIGHGDGAITVAVPVAIVPPISLSEQSHHRHRGRAGAAARVGAEPRHAGSRVVHQGSPQCHYYHVLPAGSHFLVSGRLPDRSQFLRLADYGPPSLTPEPAIGLT